MVAAQTDPCKSKAIAMFLHIKGVLCVYIGDKVTINATKTRCYYNQRNKIMTIK